MSMLAVQAVSAVPESLLLIDSPAAEIAGRGDDEAGAGGLFLNIGAYPTTALLIIDVASGHSLFHARMRGNAAAGLMNGLLLRTEVDKVTGQLSDTRTRFLGTKAPKLFPVCVRGRRSMLALSSRPWLVRHFGHLFQRASVSSGLCHVVTLTSVSSVHFDVFTYNQKPYDMSCCAKWRRATPIWAGTPWRHSHMRHWIMLPALRQTSARKASVRSPEMSFAFSPWNASEWPSTSR